MSPRLCSWLLATTLVLATGARVLAVPTGEIACGETETRVLTSQPEELVFYAQAGEVVVASVLADPPVGGFDPRWRIADVEGRPVALSNGDHRCRGRCATAPLPRGGAFTLRIADSGVGKGAYVVSFEAVSATANGRSNGPPAPACRRLVDGVADGTLPVLDRLPIVGAIFPRGESDTFTIDVAAGQAVRVDLKKVIGEPEFEPVWRAYDTTGAALAWVDDDETVPVATPGVVTVLVADAANRAVGTYAIAITVVTPAHGTTSTTTTTSPTTTTGDAPTTSTTGASSTTTLGGGSTTSTTGVVATTSSSTTTTGPGATTTTTTTLPPVVELEQTIQAPVVGVPPRLGSVLVASPERLVIGIPHAAARHGRLPDAGGALVVDVAGAPGAEGFGAVVGRLEDASAAPGGRFGAAVAWSAPRVLVGAPGSRAVTLFADVDDPAPRRSGSAASGPDDAFGAAVAFAGDTLVVGAPRGAGGRGVVHRFDPTTGVATDSLEPPAGDDVVGFGAAVAAADGLVLVGAPGDATRAGVAVLFDAATGAALRSFRLATPAPGDGFGAAVALEAGRAIVGAPGAADGRGRVVAFDTATGRETFVLVPPDALGAARFGAAVALGDGLVAAGAPEAVDEGVEGGAALTFAATTGTPDRTLRKDVPDAGDGFGAAVAAAGGRLFVGVPGDDGGTTDGGNVYVYEGTSLIAAFRERLSIDGFGAAVTASGAQFVAGAPNGGARGDGWIARLDPATGEAAPAIAAPEPGARRFGAALASVGATVAVGAPETDTSAGQRVGAVYLYDGPVLQTTIAHPKPAAGDEFGFAVARLDGDVLASAPFAGDGDTGRVYRLGPAGALRATYAKPTPTAGDFFGAALAADAGQLLVGAPLDASGGAPMGAVHLFDAESAALVRTLHNPAGEPDLFGAAVALGPWIAVGAPLADDATLGGAVYVFDRATGSIVRRIDNPRPSAGDGFGSAVAIFDDLLAVGAPFADEAAGGDVGRVYLFDAATGVLRQTLRDPKQGAFDLFGFAVAGGGVDLFVGSPGTSSVYLFDVAGAEVALSAFRVAAAPRMARLAAPGAVCGNGLVEAGEACDDGNLDDADDCRNDCTPGPCCALDAVADAVARCDDGNPCTTDIVDPAIGCRYEPSGAPGCCTTDADCPDGQCRLCVGCFIYDWDCCERGSRCIASNPACAGETCVDAAYCQCGGKLDCGGEPVPDELRAIFDGACDQLRLQASVVPGETPTREQLALARQRTKSARSALRRTIRTSRVLLRDGSLSKTCRKQVVEQARVVKRAIPRGKKLRRCVLSGG